MDVHIDDSEIMTHILSNLPESYKNILEILEDDLDYDNNPQTIDRIHDKLLVRYDQMNEQPETRTSRED